MTGPQLARSSAHPTDYTGWTEDDNVAWRWVDDPNCDNYDCWQINVISRSGCPDGLYVEMNLFDNSDVVIDYTNDSLGSLPKGQVAVLTLEDIEGNSASGRIEEINCY